MTKLTQASLVVTNLLLGVTLGWGDDWWREFRAEFPTDVGRAQETLNRELYAQLAKKPVKSVGISLKGVSITLPGEEERANEKARKKLSEAWVEQAKKELPQAWAEFGSQEANMTFKVLTLRTYLYQYDELKYELRDKALYLEYFDSQRGMFIGRNQPYDPDPEKEVEQEVKLLLEVPALPRESEEKIRELVKNVWEARKERQKAYRRVQQASAKVKVLEYILEHPR